MLYLVLGVLLWSFMHLLPATNAGFRRKMIERMGLNKWKGIFALIMLGSIALIIVGWKSTVPELLYLPPVWGRHVTMLLVLIAFILFSASHSPNNFKRLVRHPQLSGVLLWGIGHLLSNGELRSVVLFGGLAAWAALSILVINRRDGEWTRPGAVPVKSDIKVVVGGVVVYAVFVFAHGWLFGVSPIAM